MNKVFLMIAAAATFTACKKLDLNPTSSPSTETFYTNQTELELAVNDLYQIDFWGNDDEFFSDNCWNRGKLTNSVIGGTMTADDDNVNTYWSTCYKAIARVNAFLAGKDKAADVTPAEVMVRLEAEARLVRAYEYSRLVAHFGDVPLLTTAVTLEESYGITRTAASDVLSFVFSELDFAAANLPETYAASELKRLTKGAALAVKARTALYAGEWALARDAAAAVMELAAEGVYGLHADYRELFLNAGETSNELIISIPRDESQGVYISTSTVQNFISRNAGGYGAYIPMRELMDAYECTDGQPINISSLYDPHQPFKNRDPRLTATIVEFGTDWLGYTYQPHPDTLTVYSSKQNQQVTNKDNRAVAQFASYTGFLWKKGIDQTWADRLVADNDDILFRYAEILLTYAEAKIELGETDASVLNAINQVRARAYNVGVDQTGLYPAITSTSVTELREIVRRERRVELANEGLRYMDLIRWKLAEKALTRPVIGLPDPSNQDRSKWPFPGVTPIDADGIADYSGFGADVKQLVSRNFDKSRQYLWPIPAVEIRVNPSISQNPGY